MNQAIKILKNLTIIIPLINLVLSQGKRLIKVLKERRQAK